MPPGIALQLFFFSKLPGKIKLQLVVNRFIIEIAKVNGIRFERNLELYVILPIFF